MTITFVLPVFNLSANIWRAATPTTDPPDVVSVAQLYFNTRGLFDITPTVDTEWEPPIYLRVPAGTDIRHNDQVEVADGDGWFYRVRWFDRVHRGFPNEYLVAVLEQVIVPTPPPPVSGDVLTEGGDFVLLESGDFILLE